LWVPRIAALGHEVVISAPFSYSGAPLSWRQFQVLPGGLEPQSISELLAGHYGFAQADIMISLCDGWVIEPDRVRGMNLAQWNPVDCTPLSNLDDVRLRASGATVIAMSRFGERQLIAADYQPAYVPHGVDTAVYAPPSDRDALRKRMDVDPDMFIIGILAANKDQTRKAFPEQMAAFAEFHARHPNSMLAIHSAVEQPTGHRLKSIGAMLGINDCVMTPDPYAYAAGLHTPRMLADWYGALDLLSNASYAEGFGIPIIEAQACGTPVVVTDASSMTELCGSGWKVKGERYWAGGHEAWWTRPSIAGILRAYEQAWQAREDGRMPALRAKARQFALRYDADEILNRYWKPVLLQLEDNLTRPDVVTSPEGLKWKISDNNYSTGDRLGAEHEAGMENVLFAMLPPAGVFLDIGSHVGHYTLRAAARGATVIAIEANPATAERLAENLALNDLTAKVTVHNVAAWDEKTTLKLIIPSKAPRDGSSHVEAGDGGIPALPLDDLLSDAERIDLVKMDVEGADLHALRGMRETLSRLKPLLYIEDHSIYGYYTLDELVDQLDELGYDHDPALHFGGCRYWLARPREA
jgi:FkbM family methyltransferase